jgi:hypothetical protein
MGLLFRFLMRRAVQPHDDPGPNADEVTDIWSDRHLPAELLAAATVSQAPPHDRFGKRHCAAQMPRASELEISEAAHATRMIDRGRHGRKHPHPPPPPGFQAKHRQLEISKPGVGGTLLPLCGRRDARDRRMITRTRPSSPGRSFDEGRRRSNLEFETYQEHADAKMSSPQRATGLMRHMGRSHENVDGSGANRGVKGCYPVNTPPPT